MNTFSILQPDSVAQASTAASDRTFRLSVLKAGGMDVVDHLKEGLLEPNQLINLRSIKDDELRSVSANRIGALATLSDIASSSDVLSAAPVLAQACGSAATPQVRNVASAAGNLLQRPRCWYYRNAQFNCLKKGGSRCYAAEGEHENHAIFGNGPCHIVNPSNLALALYVLDGVVHVQGREQKNMPIDELYFPIGQHIVNETTLRAGDVITHITYTPAANSGFYAVKHKQSFDWPIVMVGAALELNGSKISKARVVAGAVAPTPWRMPDVDNALVGVDVNDDDALRKACDRSAVGAQPMAENGYKVDLLKVATRRAVRVAAGMEESA